VKHHSLRARSGEGYQSRLPEQVRAKDRFGSNPALSALGRPVRWPLFQPLSVMARTPALSRGTWPSRSQCRWDGHSPAGLAM